ncbi:stage III sporulation protein AF [Anaerotaenia torta]|uniref:stage III sporulation protein AF n=1 Tax=Anaerotaenia torta TaxID=433293 RepID=UPI003D1D84BD
MATIYQWIRNIVVYMMLNTIIMNLLGDKSYKKYVGIVSGMILVLIILSPLMNYMDLGDMLDYYLQANDFAVEASEFKSDLRRMEETQTDAIFAEYKERIRQQIEGILAEEKVKLLKADITIDREPTSPTFGEIMEMSITARKEKEEEEGNTGRLAIDQIEISPISIGEQEKAKKPPSPLEINIKNRLSDFYNMEQVNINITIE